MFEDLTPYEALLPTAAPPDVAALDPRLRLFSDESLSVWYAPVGTRTPRPRVWILGITPGQKQMLIAYAGAARALADGLSPAQAAARPKPEMAFAGSMRTNLITMLDALGLHQHTGVNTSAELFGGPDLRTGSALRFPVLVRDRNYTGSSPKPTRHRVLRAMLDELLAEELRSARDALIIPLGKAVEETLRYSIEAGRANPDQILWGFPHPSGANGHRHAQFKRHRTEMAERLRRWFEHAPEPFR